MTVHDDSAERADGAAATDVPQTACAGEGQTADRAPGRSQGAQAPTAQAAGAARTRAGGAALDATRVSPTLDALFEPEIASMHGVEVDVAARGRVGRLWEIDPAFGQGSYWYYALDDHVAVVSLEVRFDEPVSFACDACDFLCLGSYGRAAVPCFHSLQNISNDDSPSDRTLLGYAWRRRPFTQATRTAEPYDITSVVMRPRAIQRYALRCGCDPLALSRAITALDGTHDVMGLNNVFDEIRRARPGATWAGAYFDAKVIEALTLVLDWDARRTRDDAPEMRLADHRALTAARDHLRENLSRQVGTAELCEVALVSESKLTRLFRQAEGVSPQEYARQLRMDRACELLATGDATMAQIARELGFSRQGSFSEAFRDRFGVTPRDYRRLCRERTAALR